jgi:homogentisate phytyltransferase / homogentisate geranylgeranyltransferase
MKSASSSLPLDHPPFKSSQLFTLTWWRGLYRFSRPESTLGSMVMSTAIALALLPALPSDPVVFVKIVACVLATSLWTVAGHGINQIYDLPIDRINKPEFPLPSGVMTVEQAWVVSITTGVLGSLLAWWSMPPWLALSFVGFMTWASLVYSVPRFGSRMVRQSPWLTKLFTLIARGTVLPAGTFLTLRWLAPEQGVPWTYLAFLLTFAVFFCVGMNTFEDISDMKGDLEGNYRSFALALGAVKTAGICFIAFICAFLSLAAWMLVFPQLFRVGLGLTIEAALLAIFVLRFRRMLHSELRFDGQGAKPFYTFLWRLYAIQYVALLAIFSPTQLPPA